MNELDKLIIKGICACKTNKQIAKDLGLSVPTTALRINKIYAKLGVTTRYELIFKVTTEEII
jgi:DNA-binding NarL/FixJ family response regulator